MKGRYHFFKLTKRLESIGVVFTVSQRKIHQSTVARLKGYPTRGGPYQTISCVLTVLALHRERRNAAALLLATGVMGSTMVRFVIRF